MCARFGCKIGDTAERNVHKHLTQPAVTVAMLALVLVLGLLGHPLLPGFGMASAMTDEECEEDPKCEVVVVTATRPTHRAFVYMLHGEMRQEGYAPPEAPGEQEQEEEEEEEQWECGPLQVEFDLILGKCEYDAQSAHGQCKAEYAKQGLIAVLLEEAFEVCDDQLATALERCAADDERRRGTLPPECDDES